MARISLLSVVREKGADRYMAVQQVVGEEAECAWFEDGLRRTGRFPLEALETVSALDADDARWREAFRAAGHKREG